MKIIFSRNKSSKKKVKLGTVTKLDLRSIIQRVILALLIVIITAGMYLSLVSKSAGWIVQSVPNLKEGDISLRREIAPFDFVVPKSERELEQERTNAEYAELPIFTLDMKKNISVGRDIDSLFTAIQLLLDKDYPDSLKRMMQTYKFGRLEFAYVDSFAMMLSKKKTSFRTKLKESVKLEINALYNNMIVSSIDDLMALTDEFFVLEEGDDSRTVQISETLGVSEAAEQAGNRIVKKYDNELTRNQKLTLKSIVAQLVQPNVWYNRNKSMEVRNAARAAVPEFIAAYKKNQEIIDANERATAHHVAVLEAMKKELSRRSFLENRREHYLNALGKTIVSFGIIALFVAYLFLYRRKIYDSFSQLLLLTIIIILPLSTSFYSAWSGGVSEYLIPVAIASILTTILFDAELGIITSILISVYVSTMIPGSGIRLGIIYFLAGGVGAMTVGRVRHRREFYRSMFFLPLTMIFSIAATNDWLAHPSVGDLGNDMFLGAMNGFFCPIIAIGILPLLESIFKVTTDITLLELSDLNNPLLKELAVKAPGTFSSVLVVGTLAEAGAEKIGANPLLARVGSYYHDIGKMVIPEYFIENQMDGENPHDRLSPHMSALVIASHVKEGHELGARHGLPEAILDIIQQHHGTSLMASIYHKAVEDAGDSHVDESAFRYPGPKPQSREAGIVMLADLVEAASRSVRERSPGRLKTLINTIIQKRFLDGELDECDLTLKDLHDIEESFLPVLVGSHHGRIQYPWQEKNEKNNDKTQSEKALSGDRKTGVERG